MTHNHHFEEAARKLVGKMTLEEKISQMKHTAPAIDRLGIQAYNWWSESPHGVGRCGVATVFPQSIAMAASFNTDRMQQVGDAVSDEVRAKYNEFKKQGFTDIYQGLTVCGPVLNIARDPRWGRVQETYGEDPYLTGRMGAAYVKGMQGEGQYRKAANVLEHFAAHSGPENGRLEWNTVVGDEDLKKTYLPAFAYCIQQADPAGVMPAYNNFRGVPCCMNSYLLKEVLRNQLGFQGFTESDAGEIEYSYKIQDQAKSLPEMAALCVKAGCDLSIGDANEGFAYEHLKEAVDAGLITEEEIDEAVVRIMAVRFSLGMFDPECSYNQIPYDQLDSKENRALNRQMAQESIVLLKNDGLLPLNKKTNVAVIGPNADEKLVLLGNYYGYPTHYSTFLNGIQQQAEGKVLFARGITPFGSSDKENDTPLYEAVIAAQKSDVVVMLMGLNPVYESEECDFNGDRRDIELPPAQKKLYETVRALGKPIVFVNVSGSCVNLSVQDKECNAVVQCFYPGAEGGRALADILYGQVSPSGRLPLTFYSGEHNLPPIGDYSMANRTYRYYTGQPVYPFGHGLTYSHVTEKWLDDQQVELTNDGDMDTLYSVLRYEFLPEKTLTGFEKVFLRQGETKHVFFRKDEFVKLLQK